MNQMHLTCMVLLVGFSASLDMKKLLLSKEHSKKRGCFLGHCDGTSPQFEEEGEDDPDFKRKMFDVARQHEKEWRDNKNKNMPKAWKPPAEAVKIERNPFDAVPAEHDPSILGTATPAWARTPDTPQAEVPLHPEFENHSGHAKAWQEEEKNQYAKDHAHEGFLGDLETELRSQFTEGKEAFRGHLVNTEWSDLPNGPSVAEVRKAIENVENIAMPAKVQVPKMEASPAKGLNWDDMMKGADKAREAAGAALQNAFAPKEQGAKMETEVEQQDVKTAEPYVHDDHQEFFADGMRNPNFHPEGHKETDEKPAQAWKPAEAWKPAAAAGKPAEAWKPQNGKEEAKEEISVQAANPSATNDAFKLGFDNADPAQQGFGNVDPFSKAAGSVEMPKFENPFASPTYAGSDNAKSAENAQNLFDVVNKQMAQVMGPPTVAPDHAA